MGKKSKVIDMMDKGCIKVTFKDKRVKLSSAILLSIGLMVAQNVMMNVEYRNRQEKAKVEGEIKVLKAKEEIRAGENIEGKFEYISIDKGYDILMNKSLIEEQDLRQGEKYVARRDITEGSLVGKDEVETEEEKTRREEQAKNDEAVKFVSGDIFDTMSYLGSMKSGYKDIWVRQLAMKSIDDESVYEDILIAVNVPVKMMEDNKCICVLSKDELEKVLYYKALKDNSLKLIFTEHGKSIDEMVNESKDIDLKEEVELQASGESEEQKDIDNKELEESEVRDNQEIMQSNEIINQYEAGKRQITTQH